MLEICNRIFRNKIAARHQRAALRPSSRGQGMVEFALILPLLLLLVFGIFELGRMLVIFSSVQAASREAARYASAAGNASAGLPYYLDVAGITAAAHRVAMLVEPDSVNITWDSGPGSTPRTNVTSASSIHLGDRVNVTVTATFEPMLGLTPIQGFPITTTTSRTIIKEVAIGAGSGGGGGGGTPPEVTITAPNNGNDVIVTAGEAINFNCTATDADGQDVTITWQEGGTTISNSASFSLSSLTSGVHILTCRGVDTDNEEGTDQIQVTVNAPPWVVIDSPNGNVSYEEGTLLTFTGRAGDTEDGDLSSSIVWFDNGVEFGNGATFDSSTLAIGPHAIIARVTDSALVTVSSTAITFAIISRTPPELTVISPPDGVYYARNTNVVFQATAIDAKDGDLSSAIRWSSSLDGNLGTGSTVSTTRLRTGTHVITVSVTDSDNLTTTETLTVIIVDDDPPVVDIRTPLSAQRFSLNQSIAFSAIATDTNDGNLSADLEWYSSSIEGDQHIGSGASFSFSGLTVGTHTITARVTDSDGLTGADQVVIFIDGVTNTPPQVVITTPLDNAGFTDIQPIRFSGTATDVPDGSISSLIQWVSSLSGSLGTGSVITSTLTPGTHIITATVTDSGGLTAFDTVSVNVRDVVCPSSGNVVVGFVNNNFADKITWFLTVPSTATPQTFAMTSLSIDLFTNPSSAAVSQILVDGDDTPFGVTGTVIRASNNPVWTDFFPAMNQLEIQFNFPTNQRIGRNQGSYFRLNAVFEGCPDGIQAEVLP